ncbi:hypothetical protein TSUD_410650 [Trifolium subterraneum]|uniref:Replication factor A C-terminal domain-containing protein n=1 Tax=Trifolium subterraneum TaxID=3900 RepID=A0A2Z6P2V9_TRISU|nr:hypothetical protein TSUD_410650 [Trifolium subterraneum]
MKVKVIDGDGDVVFSLFDEEVEIMAMETCPLLQSMGESSSLFPDEMDTMYGNVVLYRIEKNSDSDNENLSEFKVLSICQEIAIVNMFIDKYLPTCDNAISFSDVCEISMLYDHSIEEDIENKVVVLSNHDVNALKVFQGNNPVEENLTTEERLFLSQLPNEIYFGSPKCIKEEFFAETNSSKRKADAASIVDVKMKSKD